MVRVSDFYIIIDNNNNNNNNSYLLLFGDNWKENPEFRPNQERKEKKRTRWKQKKEKRKKKKRCKLLWELRGKKSTDSPQQEYSWIDSLWFMIRGNRWGSSDSQKSTDSVKTLYIYIYIRRPIMRFPERTNEQTNDRTNQTWKVKVLVSQMWDRTKGSWGVGAQGVPNFRRTTAGEKRREKRRGGGGGGGGFRSCVCSLWRGLRRRSSSM